MTIEIDNSARIAEIERRVAEALKPAMLEVIDDSHLHRGHEGAKGGAGHFTLKVASAQFEGKSMIEQHRMIYQILEPMFPHEIHALSIQTYLPK